MFLPYDSELARRLTNLQMHMHKFARRRTNLQLHMHMEHALYAICQAVDIMTLHTPYAIRRQQICHSARVALHMQYDLQI